MSQPNDKHAELDALVNKLVDGQLDDAGGARLNELLYGDPDACEFYLNHMALHAHLKWEMGAATPTVIVPSASAFASQRTLRPWQRYAIAAMVLLTLTLAAAWVFRTDREDPIVGPFIATVEKIDSAQWRGDGPRSVGQKLRPGEMSLVSGTAVLRFSSGASVVITGPADFTLESPKGIDLRSGSVLVVAPPEASGFTVRTAAGRFIDLGTEFGVSINADRSTDVQVYQGVVIARPGANDLVVPVLAREAGRMDAERGDLVSIPFDAGRYPAASSHRATQPASANPSSHKPLPPTARIVFMGDRATDRETHLLLIGQAFQKLLGTSRPALFNAGESLMLSYTEPDFQEDMLTFRPTHVVIEFGPQIALAPRPRTPEKFEADIVRLLDRLKTENIEPIITTGFPVGQRHVEAQRLLDGYNQILRRLAAERGLRLADAEKQFYVASRSGMTLVADNGTDPTFAGDRELAKTLLSAMGYPDAPIETTLHTALLPGVIPQWWYHAKPFQQKLDPQTVRDLEPDAAWKILTIPQPEDTFLGRLADSSHSITYRDRARGFATNLLHHPGEITEAVAYIDSDRDKNVFVNTGAMLNTIWLNGEKIFDRDGKWTGWHAGKERIPAHLKTGQNKIVIEIESSFFLSITESRDWPLP